MIPKNGWKNVESAPRDGSIVIAKFREFNKRDGREQLQAAQWLCDADGKNWAWRKPWHFGTIAHMDAWMTPAELLAAQAEEAGEIVGEYDL